MTNEMRKRFMFFSAVCNIVQIFGETELGSCEVDEEAVAEYTMSDHFVAHLFSCTTKEEVYEKVTNDILNGFGFFDVFMGQPASHLAHAVHPGICIKIL